MKKAFSFLFLLVFVSLSAFGATHLEVTVFDCGQGNAVAARFGTESMIFDAGSKARSKFVHYQDALGDESEIDREFLLYDKEEAVWLPFSSAPTHLEASKDAARDREYFINEFKKYVFGTDEDKITLKGVFLSHPDVDHYNIVTELVQSDPASFASPTLNFLMGGARQTYETLRQALNKISPAQRPTVQCDHTAGKDEFIVPAFTTKDDDEEPEIKILTVNSKRSKELKDRNANSMVVKISQTHSFMISGDAEKETWADISKASDVLLLAHHGARTKASTTLDLIQEISPKICLISAGFLHSHPDKETIEILKTYYTGTKHRVDPHLLTYQDKKKLLCAVTNFPIFTTIDNGCLSLDLGAPALSVKPARDWWPDPYGLTLVGKDSESAEESHQDYISTRDVRGTLPGAVLQHGKFEGHNIHRSGTDLFYKYNGLYFKIELNEI